MKKYEQKTFPPETRQVLIETVCDFCGNTTKDDWNKDQYDDVDTTISMKVGERYPSASYGTFYSFDICPNCFTGKLIPWAKTFGAEPTEKDYDY